MCYDYNIMLDLSSINMDFGSIPDGLIIAIFLAFILGVIIMTMILTYHWRNFGFRSHYVRSARNLYLAGIISITLGISFVLFIILSLK